MSIIHSFTYWALTATRPCAMCWEDNGKQDGRVSCPHKFSQIHNLFDSLLSPPRAKLGYTCSPCDTERGLSQTASSEPEPCNVLPRSDGRRAQEDGSICLSDSNSMGQIPDLMTELSLTPVGLLSTRHKQIIPKSQKLLGALHFFKSVLDRNRNFVSSSPQEERKQKSETETTQVVSPQATCRRHGRSGSLGGRPGNEAERRRERLCRSRSGGQREPRQWSKMWGGGKPCGHKLARTSHSGSK